jgi:uncharacterized repeat protein (TIGR02543 family)
MTAKSFKIFAIGLLAAAAIALGVVAPANAATMTGITATTTTPLVKGQLNAAPIVVTFTTPTAIPGGSGTNSQINVRFPGTTGFTSGVTPCGSLASVSASPTPTSVSCLQATERISVMLSGGAAPGVSWTVTIAANTLTMPAAGNSLNIQIDSSDPPTTSTIDMGSVAIPFVATNSTVAFNANGGSGTIADQSASIATVLTSNAFTKAGYTFNGWNTAADGTGTAYADGASYSFEADVTLYAQWKAALANTGFDGVPYLATGGVLGLAGALIILFARRRQSN